MISESTNTVEETMDSKPPAVVNATDSEQGEHLEAGETADDMGSGDQKWSSEEEKIEEPELEPTLADIGRPLNVEEGFINDLSAIDEQPTGVVPMLKDPPPSALDAMGNEVSIKLDPPASNVAAAATTRSGEEARTAADEAAKAAAKAAMPARKPGAVASAAPPSGKEIAEANFNSAAADGGENPKTTATGGGEDDSESPGKRKEINPSFQDVQKTGKWGNISKVEVYGVVAFSVISVVVAIIVIAVMVSRDNGAKEVTVPPATPAPTPMVTPIPAEERLRMIMKEVQDNPVASRLATNGTLPSDLTYYEGLLDSGVDCSLMPHECAMAWAIYEDTFPPATDVIAHRFAMASFYYSLGGEDWKVNTNWTTNSSYCDWHGIKCNRGKTDIEELYLPENNLVGEIPLALALVDTIAVISLKENAIGGNLPGDVIAHLPKLFSLYLQSNDLVGTIPENLRDNGALCESNFLNCGKKTMTFRLTLPPTSLSDSIAFYQLQ
jgi:hypothetical protein